MKYLETKKNTYGVEENADGTLSITLDGKPYPNAGMLIASMGGVEAVKKRIAGQVDQILDLEDYPEDTPVWSVEYGIKYERPHKRGISLTDDINSLSGGDSFGCGGDVVYFKSYDEAKKFAEDQTFERGSYAGGTHVYITWGVITKFSDKELSEILDDEVILPPEISEEDEE